MRDHDLQPGSTSIVKACGLNMAATTQSICKTLNGKNHRTLAPHCPAEAKAHRAAARKKECEGHTAREDLSRCLSGADSKEESGGDEDREKTSDKQSSNNPAATAIAG